MLKMKLNLLLVITVLTASIFIFLNLTQTSLDKTKEVFENLNATASVYIIVKKPFEAQGIYVTSNTAASPKRMNELIQLIKETELNSIVIDIKNSRGSVVMGESLDLLLKRLLKEEIYTIARIVVFQDPEFIKARPELALKDKSTGKIWRNFRGIPWLDPASKEVWDYNAALARRALKMGFDEVNFDYVRFPSDGKLSNIVYPIWDGKGEKHEVIGELFDYLSQKVKLHNKFLSVDLFGLVLTRDDGLGIGQRLIDAAGNFDFISPMVYPSHYYQGFDEFTEPVKHPYEVIYRSLSQGKEALKGSSSRLRPWLQDFDQGAVYDERMVRLEIKATRDAGAFGWLLWNPYNVYTREALQGNSDL